MTKRDSVEWCNRGWYPVFYGFCPSEVAWDRQMKKMGIKGEPYPGDDGRMTCFKAGGNATVIVTITDGAEGTHSLLEIVGLLVHEAVHVWQEIQKHIGEDAPGSEVDAYSVQAIAQELLEAFDKTRGLPGVKA